MFGAPQRMRGLCQLHAIIILFFGRGFIVAKEKKVLRLYLVIVFAISAVVGGIWIYSGDAGSLISQLLMLVPLAAALILKAIFYRKQSLLGFRAGKIIYLP